jgi:hypothetical protein
VISEETAREIAAAEAGQAYHDLSGYAVTARLADGRWYVDYDLTDETLLGGGPHFVIDAASGEITARRYEQ